MTGWIDRCKNEHMVEVTMARLALALSVTVALGTLASSALAGSSGTADVSCGCTSASWNAPTGALVRSRGTGPVRDVINGIGESATHVIVSNGLSWATHASMFSPGTNGWPTYCSTPLKANELQNGFPGLEQINMGAMYTYTYGNGANEYFRYQVDTLGSGYCRQQSVAQWLWNSVPYTTLWNGSYYFYKLNNGANINYSLYQFRDVEGVPTGGYSWNNGMVCSSSAAWAQYKAVGIGVTPYYYSQSQKVNAINALYNGVESSCNSGLGFWGGVGAAITCFEGICDDAARQVANCMSRAACDTDDDGWQTVRDNTGYTVRAISPDRMAGLSGHTNTGSVWAGSSDFAVSWNSPGQVCGCWF